MISKDINGKVLDYEQKVKVLDFDFNGKVIEFLHNDLVTIKYKGNRYRDIKANRLEII